jgi:hypothetical protein
MHDLRNSIYATQFYVVLWNVLEWGDAAQLQSLASVAIKLWGHKQPSHWFKSMRAKLPPHKHRNSKLPVHISENEAFVTTNAQAAVGVSRHLGARGSISVMFSSE